MSSAPLPSSSLLRVCHACVDLLAITGAGISVLTDEGGGGTVSASSEKAAQLEEMQFSLGEGPCRVAYASGRSVLVDDVVEDAGRQSRNWPMFGAAATEAGVRAMFAFPLRWAGQSIGVLDLFRDSEGPLSVRELGLAAALADLASEWLLQLRDVPDEVFVDSAEDRSSYRVEVYQASGMVSAQLDIGPAEALVRMRARAFTEGRLLSELAADVVNRRVRFGEDDL